ncbi:mitochondrial carrier domain-containing protein [Hyaloraphidium curvatum]|nr:mitochondrial carrier domain-containing protein [Hyaloraphidium curvatum]
MAANEIRADPYRVLKDILAGATGGVAQVLMGQPFDTVKVRLQTQSVTNPEYKGVADAARKIVAKEGPLALYKGTLTPLLGVGTCVAVQFWVLEWMKRTFMAFNARNLGEGAGNNGTLVLLSKPQLAASAGAAGFVNSFIAGPVENVRIRLQTQQKAAIAPGYQYYAGPTDAFRQIARLYGLRGLFHGQVPTCYRETAGFASYFFVYEFLSQQRMKKHGTTDRAIITPMWSIIFGSLSGLSFWLASYPFDVVKSRIQTDSMDKRYARYKGMGDCFRQTWQAERLPGFTRGLSACMLRAAPANAATFVAFEAALKWLNKTF